MEITIRVQKLHNSPVRNGRVKAGENLNLDVSRIKKILAWQRRLYVTYETDRADYYGPYAEQPPLYAVELQYRVQKYRVDICNKCGSFVEWDADEPYCPRGCDELPGWSYRTEERERLVVEPPKASEEVKQFVEKAFKVSAEFVAAEFRNLAGGCRPLFKLTEVDFSLYQVNVVGLGVVEDPQFECSDYDSPEVEERRYKGRHIAVRVTAGTGLETLLYRFEGEPDLSVMHQLHKEYVAKKQEEEERRKRIEEEMRRRMEEEEKKRNDPSKIIEAVKAALPEWADGAVIVAKRVCSEDCDVYYLAYPVKRSSRNARYYYSPEWRTLRLAVPDRFLEKFADCIVTRDGSVIKVQRTEGSGKYVTLKPA